MKPGSRHDYEGSSTFVARIPAEFHASLSLSLSRSRRRPAGSRSSFLDSIPRHEKEEVRVMPSDPSGKVERSRLLVRTISSSFFVQALSLLILSDLEFFSFLLFFSFFYFIYFVQGEKGRRIFLSFFLFVCTIRFALWNSPGKVGNLRKGTILRK